MSVLPLFGVAPVTKRPAPPGTILRRHNVLGDDVEEWHTPYMTGGSAKIEWRQVSMRLTHTQRRRIMRLARTKERIVDQNDLHVVAIFLKGVLSGWFAVRHGWLRGGTWLFLGLAIAGLVGQVVVAESLLTAMLPIPFFLAAAVWNECLYGRWSRTAQVNRVDVGRT
jgi:hypothetical protein